MSEKYVPEEVTQIHSTESKDVEIKDIETLRSETAEMERKNKLTEDLLIVLNKEGPEEAKKIFTE